MESFYDKNGGAWDLELTIGMAMKLKSRLNFDIENLVSLKKDEKSTIENLVNDTELLFNVVYVMCEKQCIERGISQEEFAGKFDRVSIESATDSLLKEFVNFSPPVKKRILRELLKISEEAKKKIETELDRILTGNEMKQFKESALNNLLKSTPEQ